MTRGLTLVEVLVVAMALLIVVVLVLPAIAQVSRRDKVARCIGNLQTLHRAQASAGAPGAKLGVDFWLRLRTAQPPLVGPEALRCPLVDRPDAPECQYLGPRADPAALKDLHPIGCDAEVNHSPNMRQGGNVLLKSGEVLTEKGDGGLWTDARTKYCRP